MEHARIDGAILNKQKQYKSARKLESLPDGSKVEFVGGVNRWEKEAGRWIVRGYGIPFSAQSLVNFTGGRPFVVMAEVGSHE